MSDGTDGSHANLLDINSMTIEDIPDSIKNAITQRVRKKLLDGVNYCIKCGSNRCHKIGDHEGLCCEHDPYMGPNFKDWCSGCRTLYPHSGMHNIMIALCEICGEKILYEHEEGFGRIIPIDPHTLISLNVSDGKREDGRRYISNMNYRKTICSEKCLKLFAHWIVKKGLEAFKEESMVIKVMRHTRVKPDARDLYFCSGTGEEKYEYMSREAYDTLKGMPNYTALNNDVLIHTDPDDGTTTVLKVGETEKPEPVVSEINPGKEIE